MESVVKSNILLGELIYELKNCKNILRIESMSDLAEVIACVFNVHYHLWVFQVRRFYDDE